MLRVTIEVIPFRDEEEKFDIRTLEIANFGYSTLDRMHNYKYRDRGDKEWREEVLHNREDGAEELVRKVLERELS